MNISKLFLLHVITSLILVCELVPAIPSGFCEPSSIVDPDIENALLVQDWRAAKDKCGPIENMAARPVLAGIKGHACLMLNQNNESLALFLSMATRSDLESWRDWTDGFAQKNAWSCVAHYLKGDALARLEEFDAAIRAFKESMRLAEEQHSQSHSALNALGVVYCATKQWDMAESCFKKVIAFDQNFADAYANLGTMSLYRKRLRQASIAYEQAVSKSQTFALGLNGRGCANFLDGPKHWEQARKDFAAAGEQMGLAVIAFSADQMNQAAFDAASKANLYFHDPGEFSDWNAVQQVIHDHKSILGGYFRDMDLSRNNPKKIIDRLNEIMDMPILYDDNKEVMDKLLPHPGDALLSSGIENLLIDTRDLRLKKSNELNVYESGAIRGLNRGLMYLCYPNMLNETAKTEAGMSLTLNGGIAVDGYSYKQGLSTNQLLLGKNRMEYTYRPLATALEKVQYIGFLGKMWNQHLDASLGQTNTILEQRRLSPNQIKTGGLSTEELMVLFFKRDAWKPLNWYGLAYNATPQES